MAGDLGTWLRRGVGFTIGAALIIGLYRAWPWGDECPDHRLLRHSPRGWVAAAGRLDQLTGAPGAVLLLYALFVAAVVVLMVVVAPVVVQQVQDLANSLPASLERWRGWISDLPAAVQGPLNSMIDTAQGLLRSPP